MPKLPAYKVNVLWVSDVPGWAYANCYEGLRQVIDAKFTNLNFVQCFHDDIIHGYVNPAEYDVVMLWAWINVIGPRSIGITQVLAKCPPDRTILCVASEWAANILPTMGRVLRAFRYFAGANKKVTDILAEGLPWVHSENLEHGVDTDKFKPAPFPEIFTVGWAGNQNAENKRFTMAQTICRKADVPLKVAGHKGTERYLDPDEMPDWYNSISCLLITSVTEVHPLVYYEAAACGRPAVSTIVGDIGVGRAKAGIFLNVNDSEDLFVMAVNRFKRSPSELMRQGILARMEAIKYWDWERIAPKYVQYILKVKNHGV